MNSAAAEFADFEQLHNQVMGGNIQGIVTHQVAGDKCERVHC